MNLFIYFCIPLIVTGNPTPGTYGETERREDTQTQKNAQNPETSETEAYSKYAFGPSVGYGGSVLDQFVVDQHGEYRRRPLIEDTGAVDISNIYNTLKDRATGKDVPTRGSQVASPSYDYGVPPQVLSANPALLKLSNYANPLLAAQLAQQYEHRLKSVAALQTPVVPLAPSHYYSHVPLAAHQQQLVQLQLQQQQLLHAPDTGHHHHQLVQQPLYQNVLVPYYQQSPYAHAQALYHQQQQAAHHAAAHGVEQISLAQQVVPTLQVPLLKTAHAPAYYQTPIYKTVHEPRILQAPIYKTANPPAFAPLLKTAPGVQAEIVQAVEEHVPEHESIPIAKVPTHYTRFLPSDAVLVSPKTPNVFVQKAVFKAAPAAAISPVLTEKAVLKAALAPVYNSPAYGLNNGIIKAPLLTRFVQNGYLEPGLPTKILSSQKAVVNALISEGEKAHYGYGKKIVGLPAGTTIDLVPSLSYGFSYSLYPKSNGLYGAPQPLVPVGAYKIKK
ncbi:hypothetical protein Ocin01_01663 [Orchesella cincta]|uniref:Uncharacterized protein n=1 Tax=Orchesella cincta TaxID=48709 RepID=A0A1D2NIA6_ORCCI|nr:hypothetical protein Ocin01_01663 [Orchesella cincta]